MQWLCLPCSARSRPSDVASRWFSLALAYVVQSICPYNTSRRKDNRTIGYISYFLRPKTNGIRVLEFVISRTRLEWEVSTIRTFMTYPGRTCLYRCGLTTYCRLSREPSACVLGVILHSVSSRLTLTLTLRSLDAVTEHYYRCILILFIPFFDRFPTPNVLVLLYLRSRDYPFWNFIKIHS